MGSIATYSDLLSAFPSNKIMDALDNQQYDDREYEKQFTMKAGDLFRINWYRVILDEGQMIKNRATRSKFLHLLGKVEADSRSCEILLAPEGEVSLGSDWDAPVQLSRRLVIQKTLASSWLIH